MNYPIWDVPASGLLIAVVAILHVFVSHFAVGGGLFLVWYESKARRTGDSELLAFVRSHSRFFLLLTLVFGAITGVGIWFTIGLVNPQGTSALIQNFVWGWAIEWTFFVTEIAAAMVYYYGWDRLKPSVHLVVGWIYFISAWMSLFVINGILTFMLTPGQWTATRSLWDAFFNPTFWPSLVTRTLISLGLAGLYAVLTSAFLGDPALKRRIARSAIWGWTLVCAIFLPFCFAWYLAAAAGDGVPVGTILGAEGDGLAEVLTALFSLDLTAGYPLAIKAGFLGMLASLVLALVLVLEALSEKIHRPVVAIPLMVLGLMAFGGFEWVREDLRKPYVIGRYLFVNGTRLTPAWAGGVEYPNDSFSLDNLNRTGLLESAKWVRPVGTGSETDLKIVRGQEVFRLLCSSCHTVDGHLAIRSLVTGRPPSAIAGILGKLAEPVDQAGNAVAWDSPQLHLRSWRDRRMPPFAGSDAERQELAFYLASLVGTHLVDEKDAVSVGEQQFEEKCVFCHGPESSWPVEQIAAGKTEADFYLRIGNLPEYNPVMPAFEGTDEERRELARYLAELVR